MAAEETMQITQIDLDKLKQLSNYLVHGISPEQAGAAVGFSKSRVLDLMSDENFKEIYKQKQEELAAQKVDINTLYDEIEHKALTNLAKVAKVSLDPDFNMRLAMMSNRAQRKGVHENIPIDAAKVDGGRIVLHFSKTFITQVQSGPLLETRDVTVQKDELNIANPSDVKELLNIRSFRDQSAQGISPDHEIRSLASFLDE